jgi:hypothetical protein
VSRGCDDFRGLEHRRGLPLRARPRVHEQHLVATSLARLEVLATSPYLERVQVVVVDDSSRNGTAEVLRLFAAERGVALASALPSAPRDGTQPPDAIERGGGGREDRVGLPPGPPTVARAPAIQTALSQATGATSIIHHADLGYYPRDILRIVKVAARSGHRH